MMTFFDALPEYVTDGRTDRQLDINIAAV